MSMINELAFQKVLNLRLYKIFRKMGVPRKDVSLNNNLSNDLLFDNFDMNIFLFFLESKFNIEVADTDITKLTTIEHTLHFVEEKLDVA